MIRSKNIPKEFKSEAEYVNGMLGKKYKHRSCHKKKKRYKNSIQIMYSMMYVMYLLNDNFQ